jgi:hypothetical protein
VVLWITGSFLFSPLYGPVADKSYEESVMFEIVRRTELAGTKAARSREDILLSALTAVLSINVFILSSLASFCLLFLRDLR